MYGIFTYIYHKNQLNVGNKCRLAFLQCLRMVFGPRPKNPRPRIRLQPANLQNLDFFDQTWCLEKVINPVDASEIPNNHLEWYWNLVGGWTNPSEKY